MRIVPVTIRRMSGGLFDRPKVEVDPLRTKIATAGQKVARLEEVVVSKTLTLGGIEVSFSSPLTRGSDEMVSCVHADGLIPRRSAELVHRCFAPA
jgi:hypothetical protein